jgi:hypothetical protein
LDYGDPDSRTTGKDTSMNPYQNLPDKNFWKTAIAVKAMNDIEDLWDPKFRITAESKVSTFGSCFAQRIGTALKERGFHWLVTEKPPESLSRVNARKYNYHVFSARTGNIYTVSLLKQWTEWAIRGEDLPDEVWEANGRYYDPFRPRIEPDGFENADVARLSRQHTIKSFRRCIELSDLFVFTLGLTESWVNADQGYEYPMCPGTAAGEYVEEKHIFRNQTFSEIIRNLNEAIEMIGEVNKNIRFLLTVSPVPLTATKTDKNVLVATMESKSILRAVAGQVASERHDTDYFPSYEIINSPVFKGIFFEPNQRNISRTGINFVMKHFFQGLEKKYGAPLSKCIDAEGLADDQDEICDEEILDSFRQ